MSKPSLNLSVRHLNSAAVIDIVGEVTAHAESAFTEAYTQASSGGTPVILLNFAGLEYMNSSGIGLLVTFLIRANRQKQKLIAIGLNPHYQQIFELTRLNEAIGMFETEAEALAT